MTVDFDVAEKLIDFGVRMPGAKFRAKEQLEGAVAIHNILTTHGVAYLADEVGMGKTYVALGAVALFRHFQPDFRVLVVAPRENIQLKWIKEWSNFVTNNMRYSDLRVRSVDGRPARALVACESAIDLADQAVRDPNRDFFAKLTSFSLALPNETAGRDAWRARRDEVRERLPWLPDAPFDLRNKSEFKDSLARAICCALPEFDLVIIDEGHNLKHGFSDRVAARNRSLALALGRPTDPAAERVFRGAYGPRAKRVLFLSATPVEERYSQIWNQLNVVGKTDGFDLLKEDSSDDPALEQRQKELLRTFLIRRVTTMRVDGEERTKNEYRREWRNGGVREHDEPLAVEDDRKALIVALVQKKVAELLGTSKFNASFQIGMLASFESFLETAKIKEAVAEEDDDDERGNFDDPDQTEDVTEKEGVDVGTVNNLATDYWKQFDHEMPHPKMDEIVDVLASAWSTGRKALVFVRRVASVTELKRKLDERYDDWLKKRLLSELDAVRPRLERTIDRYQAERRRERDRERESRAGATKSQDAEETSNTDTFFGWFFRGTRANDLASGAVIKERFTNQASPFFTDNHVAWLLECDVEEVPSRLGQRLGLQVDELAREMERRGMTYLSRAKKPPRGDLFRAAQAAGLELLKDADHLGELATRASVVWRDLYDVRPKRHATKSVALVDFLKDATFFSELRRPEYAELRKALWPDVAARAADFRLGFREREIRAQMLSAARLGHAFIDLYVLTIRRLGTLEKGARDDEQRERILEYLRLLDEQRTNPSEWRAYAELSALAEHFDLISDVNAPELRDARDVALHESATLIGRLFRDQDPVGGMSGKVARTFVQQFRMPGYPFVLVTTDVLQEGEDLHTFCSSIYHYGISWTPSSMEQRIGRIDRVRSETDRRLTNLTHAADAAELLQVYYPFLSQTVEVLQVERVLARMNRFLRLMHEGLSQKVREEKRIHIARELLSHQRSERITGKLQTAFPIVEQALAGLRKDVAVGPEIQRHALERLERLKAIDALATYPVHWERHAPMGSLFGTATLASGRTQPFMFTLRSDGPLLLLRAISPVGRVGIEDDLIDIEKDVAAVDARAGVVLGDDERTYDLTVEEDVVLGDGQHDESRVSELLRRVLDKADALERDRLGVDQGFDVFEKQLVKETAGEN